MEFGHGRAQLPGAALIVYWSGWNTVSWLLGLQIVMFVVYLGSLLTTLLWFQSLGGQGEAPSGFILSICLWLWFTVLFASAR